MVVGGQIDGGVWPTEHAGEMERKARRDQDSGNLESCLNKIDVHDERGWLPVGPCLCTSPASARGGGHLRFRSVTHDVGAAALAHLVFSGKTGSSMPEEK